ncbi:MAG: hypothetical protein MZV70_38530 [Desulfobacterales bacterium]|nr:hypothetical protein [Desulfobacterales bacterium]
MKAQKEWTEIFKAIAGINKIGIHPCASLGIIDAIKEPVNSNLPAFSAIITTWRQPAAILKISARHMIMKKT